MNSSLWTETKESTPSLVKVLNLKPTKTAWEPLEYFFQHFIPPVFFPPVTLINPPFSLLQIWQRPPTASLSSSTPLLSSLRVALCLPGRSVRSAKVRQLKWRQIGTDQENNRVNWGWACSRTRCSCEQNALIVNQHGETDEVLQLHYTATFTERLLESLYYRHLLNQDGMQRNSFISFPFFDSFITTFNNGEIGENSTQV